jgi:hypothetical protein
MKTLITLICFLLSTSIYSQQVTIRNENIVESVSGYIYNWRDITNLNITVYLGENEYQSYTVLPKKSVKILLPKFRTCTIKINDDDRIKYYVVREFSINVYNSQIMYSKML